MWNELNNYEKRSVIADAWTVIIVLVVAGGLGALAVILDII